MPYKNIEDRRKAWIRWKIKNPEAVKKARAKHRLSKYYKENKKQESLNLKVRKQLIDERFELCELCGSDYFVEMHHRDFCNSNNERENLILVCKICHRAFHKKKRKSLPAALSQKGE